MERSNPRPLVTVITPTHNRARLLRQALDSIYGQEGIGEQFDLEVIVVDEASTDETPDIVKGCPAVKYIRLEQSGGASIGRNVGLKAATGNHVCFLDDDDVWLSWKLKGQVQVLETEPEVGLVYGQHIARFGDDVLLWPDPEAAPSGWVVRKLLLRGAVNTCNVLMRRSAVDQAGPFDERLQYWEDLDMWFRLALHCQFRFVPGPVAIYQPAPASLGYVLSGESERDLRGIVERILARLEEKEGLDPGFAVKARARVISRVAGQLRALGQAEGLRALLLRALRESSDVLHTSEARDLVAEEARRQALSRAPLTAAGDLCAELKRAIGAGGFRRWLVTRRLQAEVWRQVAVRLAQVGDERARLARPAAFRALLRHPATLGRSLARVLVGSVPFLG